MSTDTSMKTAEYALSSLIPGIPPSITMTGYENGHEFQDHVPSITDGYVFLKDVVREIRAFSIRSYGDGMFLSGPTGSGKTSVLMEMAGRLNIPVYRTQAHERLELSDLIGQWIPNSDGSLNFSYGSLAMAMIHGGWFILDEGDLADPSVLAGLNAVLEGSPLTIPEKNGEVIKPHENFRFFMTGNSLGQGDDTGMYAGIKDQNLAFMDRFIVLNINYLDAETEMEILNSLPNSLAPELLEGMISLANDVRKNFVEGDLSVTFSLRTLIRWVTQSVDFFDAPNPLKYALEKSLLNRANPQDREAIVTMAINIFGETAWQ